MLVMNRTFTALSHRVIGCAIEVHKHLGPGLLESAYQRCLANELHLNHLPFQAEVALPIKYKGINLECGYRMDILVDNTIILELKSVESIHPIHEAQILSYMRLAKLKQGFLINFNSQILKQGLKSFVL